MKRGLDFVKSSFFIVLFLSSMFFYFPIEFNENNQNIYPKTKDYTSTPVEDLPTNPNTDALFRSIETPGSYKLKGFFCHDEFVNLDSDGEVFEWENYDDMKDYGSSSEELLFRVDSNYPDTWPDQADTFYLLEETNWPYENSSMFSPVFNEETYLDGKVYFLTYLRTNFRVTVGLTITFRIRLMLFNTTDASTSEILAINDTLPAKMSKQQRVYDYTLSSPVTIPAGFRLKVTYEIKLNRLDRNGYLFLYGAEVNTAESVTWDIDDDPYSNTYQIDDVETILGVQLYMFDQTYPEITVSGFENSTIYYETKNITIDVSNAVNSSYRWDGGTYTSFDTSTTTTSPATEGWHDLEIQALDEYENNKTVLYQIGYDASEVNIILESPSNNSVIKSGTLLNFTAYYIDYATYEWDKNGTQINMTAPEYDIIAPDYSGTHNLTIRTFDVFGTDTFFYLFNFDNDPPLILLLNVVNNTILPAGKAIDVNITDLVGVDQVFYEWEGRDNLTWSPFDGSIYRTYLPETAGGHWLYVSANDSLGHAISKAFYFISDANILLVELQNLVNDSYYYGGNIVNVTITGINGTIIFYWDGGEELNGTLDAYYFNSTLILNGSNVLPLDLGVHTLTIRTFDIADTEYIFVFIFTLDQESPEIDSSINDYNNSRFLTSEVFTFLFSDNFTSGADFEVLISIDNGPNQTLSSPYELPLLSFTDGVHNFTLYVFDIANNYATAFIVFSVDTTAPTIAITSIEGLVELLGDYYIPANASVLVAISDDDPLIISSYSWGGAIYTDFIDSFELTYPDGTATLYINASDQLGNENLITITLTIDSLEPSTTFIFPYINSKINNETELEFVVADLFIETIAEVEYSWDKILPFYNPAFLDENGEFAVTLGSIINLYDNGSTVLLYIYAIDIVGNNNTHIFSLIIDKEPPVFDVLLFDEDDEQWHYINTMEEYTARGNSMIWCTNISTDWSSVIYYWDSESDRPINETTWIIYAPTIDGTHNLTIIARDDTGELSSPNEIILVYTIIVDDLTIEVVQPSNLLDQTHQLSYKDVFAFTLQIYDKRDNLSISDLNWINGSLNNNLSLLIINDTIDDRTFEFTIYTTNVGFTSLTFEFTRVGFSAHSITIDLEISKKEGSLQISENNLEAIYGERIEIKVNLQDELENDLVITEIYANNISVEFQDLGNYIYSFECTSDYYASGKGNYTLQIRVESYYYFGETNDTFIFEYEINPLPLILTVEASGLEIIEGSAVEFIAILTYLNGTPIEDIEIIFYIFVFYKNQTSNVYAAIEGYDTFEILTDSTDSNGQAIVTFLMTEEIDHIAISATCEGNQILGSVSLELEDIIRAIKPPGLPNYILYAIIAGAVLLIALASFIVYKITKKTPFEELLKKIPDQDIMMRQTELCPGAILSIFHQTKGAIPLIVEHSFNFDYGGRMVLGMENFILKVGDQAFSSLGFEEHIKGRRLGSVTLPNESMLGFIHGIQLENKLARAGYENLVISILTNLEYGTMLLAYQEVLYPYIDDLIKMLEKKDPLSEITNQLDLIRREATKVILAALELDSF